MNIININRTPYNFGFKEKRKLLNSISTPTMRELEKYFYKHFKTLPQDLPKVLEDLQEYETFGSFKENIRYKSLDNIYKGQRY